MTVDSTFAIEEAPRPPEQLAQRPLVMLIEDDFMLRSTLSELLRGQGYAVECYANGAAALARLAQEPRPGLILLDIMLPYMDGLEFRERQMASAASDIPVVVITAVGVPTDRTQALRFDRTFWKPLDVPAVLHAIHELCPLPPA